MSNIKNKIKQSLSSKLNEKFENQSSSNESNINYDKEYNEVQSKLQDTLLKQNQVMHLAGLGDPDDATARSLFSKKVRKEKNDEGGIYQFDEKELARVIKILNNPSAFLNVKN